jgi:O-antigen/teichoic acid export membrane protein
MRSFVGLSVVALQRTRPLVRRARCCNVCRVPAASDALRTWREAWRGQFQRDKLWNFASVAVLGICGFALQLAIGGRYGPAPLGVFNQVMAAYIVFGQAAVGGINLSALRGISEKRDDRQRVTAIIVGAVLPTVALAAVCTFLFWASRGVFAQWLESPGVASGMEAAAPGLFFFALNKVSMSIVNAAQRMRAFAIYTSMRYLLMVGGLVVVIASGMTSDRIAFLFTFAEGILFVPLAVEVWLQIARPLPTGWFAWTREHLRYGVKSVASGMLLDLNSRVDVLVIGLFLDDAPVGVYSIAAMVAEGLFQLLVVLQNIYNPTIAQHLAERRTGELEALVRRAKRSTYALMACVGAIAIAAFPLFVRVLDKPEFRAAWLPFGCLVAGMVAASGYMPFAQTLLMANRPGWHTLMMLVIVLFNLAGNFVLVPWLGITGSAIATGTALVFSAWLLAVMVRRHVGVRL